MSLLQFSDQHYKGGLIKWIQDYEDAFTELSLLGQKTWKDDDIKKRRLVQNAQNIGIVDTILEELVSDKSFTETCNFLRSHAIRYDQQNKENAARQINGTNQSTKRNKVKKVLALINELQVQDSPNLDEELDPLTPTKTAMVCKLAQVPPEIWMTLSLEAKKWLLNERKRQQQAEEKVKRSLAQSKNTVVVADIDNNNSSIPNQYAKVKNTAKGEEIAQNDTDQAYGFMNEFLEEAIRSSSIHESEEDVEYEYWSSDHNALTTLNISNSLHNKCRSLLLLPEKYHISILDGGADTCVLGQGWEILSIHNSRRANVVGFDHETAVKRNLPIVSAITTVDLPDGSSILLVVHEGIYNETANHSLLSEFQLS